MSRERGGTLTREYRIADLLHEIHHGSIVLPEFQRDFDWNDDSVMQLLATVARRWPAGSLLLQDFPGETFYTLRAFEGGPPLIDAKVDFVVLDGQQRLTALYHAIYDTGPYVYAIKASALIPEATIDLLEEAILSFSRKEWDASSRDAGWDTASRLIPFYALRSAADYFSWRDDKVLLSPADSRDNVRDLLSDAYRHGLEAFHTYQLPAVIVERELEPAAIARIFERVNRTGLRLSSFDLMVAKTFETGWNLRDKWETACAKFPILADFYQDDGMPVIRVIALKASQSVREGDVLRLSGLAVRNDWDGAVDACARGLTFLRDACGVQKPDWLPYGGMVITLAALALEHDLTDHTEMLVSWFLSRAFGLAYDAGANTVTVDEYKKLDKALKGQAEIERTQMIDVVVREATRKRRSAIWRAFMASLALNGARDLVTGDKAEEPRRDAHVLPRNASPAPDSESEHLRVLNLVMVDEASAQRINGGGLHNLRTVLDELNVATRAEVITSQLLPLSWDPDNARAFIEGRLQELERFLVEHVGYGLMGG